MDFEEKLIQDVKDGRDVSLEIGLLIISGLKTEGEIRTYTQKLDQIYEKIPDLIQPTVKMQLFHDILAFCRKFHSDNQFDELAIRIYEERKKLRKKQKKTPDPQTEGQLMAYKQVLDFIQEEKKRKRLLP